jgi:hypothetical protein
MGGVLEGLGFARDRRERGRWVGGWMRVDDVTSLGREARFRV